MLRRNMRAHQFTIKTLLPLASAAWVEAAQVLVFQQRSVQHGLHQLQTQAQNRSPRLQFPRGVIKT